MMKVHIGFDPREPEVYEVAKNSILLRTTSPVDVSPLKLVDLPFLTRPIEVRKRVNGEEGDQLWCPISDAPMSTEFAISRFCIPFLKDSGWALFIDDDMICLGDISELFAYADPRYAVMVVKHNHVPEETTFPDGRLQSVYSRKNWSSVMLFNCAHPAHKRLKLEDLNSWPGRDLHAFKWLHDEEIGSLPSEWNHLVDVQPFHQGVKMAHMTNGGPWIKNWTPRESDALWYQELDFQRERLINKA